MKYTNLLQRQSVKEGEKIRKAFTCDEVRSIDKEQRTIDFTISTDRVDRYGDIIMVSGWDLKEYRKNPVVLFGHNSRMLPVARALKVWKDDALHATAQFANAETFEFADTVFRMYQEKFLRAVSVGFLPIKWEDINDDEGKWTGGYKFIKQELLEFSCVPVPANPDALLEARQKGLNVDPYRKWSEELLDNWGSEGDAVKLLYGVGRREVEQIHRKAAGAGISYRVSLEEQDELRRKNLETIHKQVQGNGGSEPESVGNILEELGLEEVKPVVEEKIVKCEPAIDEVKNTCVAAGEFMFETIIREKKVKFPVIKPEHDMGDVLMRIDDDEHIVTNAPMYSSFLVDLLNNDNSMELEGSTLTLKSDNMTLLYDISGYHDGKLHGRLASVIGHDFPLKDTPKSDRENVQSENDEPIPLEYELYSLERAVLDFYDSLDSEMKNGYSLGGGQVKMLGFLTDCLKELLVKVGCKVQPEQVGEPEGATIGAVTEKIVNMGPLITAIVEKELRKARGRLD